jgi:hypothetical protein
MISLILQSPEHLDFGLNDSPNGSSTQSQANHKDCIFNLGVWRELNIFYRKIQNLF